MNKHTLGSAVVLDAASAVAPMALANPPIVVAAHIFGVGTWDGRTISEMQATNGGVSASADKQRYREAHITWIWNEGDPNTALEELCDDAMMQFAGDTPVRPNFWDRLRALKMNDALWTQVVTGLEQGNPQGWIFRAFDDTDGTKHYKAIEAVLRTPMDQTPTQNAALASLQKALAKENPLLEKKLFPTPKGK